MKHCVNLFAIFLLYEFKTLIRQVIKREITITLSYIFNTLEVAN